MARFCEYPECINPVFRGDLCAAHTKQMQRRGKLTACAIVEPPFSRMLDSHGDIRDARDRGQENRAAMLRFRKATIAWLMDDGWKRVRFEGLIASFTPVAEADTDSDFTRAMAAFQVIAGRWARAQGMRPPKRKRVPPPVNQLRLWAA